MDVIEAQKNLQNYQVSVAHIRKIDPNILTFNERLALFQIERKFITLARNIETQLKCTQSHA